MKTMTSKTRTLSRIISHLDTNMARHWFLKDGKVFCHDVSEKYTSSDSKVYLYKTLDEVEEALQIEKIAHVSVTEEDINVGTT